MRWCHKISGKVCCIQLGKTIVKVIMTDNNASSIGCMHAFIDND